MSIGTRLINHKSRARAGGTDASSRIGRVALVCAAVIVSGCSSGQDATPTTTTTASPTTTASAAVAAESVANAFMDAIDEHDESATRELVAPDYDFDQSNPPGVFDWERAVGWRFLNQGCEERSSGSDGTLVDCPFLQENDWMRALGLDPWSGNREILVAEGQIQSMTDTETNSGGIAEAYRAFRAWVNENHPDDVATMFGPGDRILPEAFALYEQYTDEFVASIEG